MTEASKTWAESTPSARIGAVSQQFFSLWFTAAAQHYSEYSPRVSIQPRHMQPYSSCSRRSFAAVDHGTLHGFKASSIAGQGVGLKIAEPSTIHRHKSLSNNIDVNHSGSGRAGAYKYGTLANILLPVSDLGSLDPLAKGMRRSEICGCRVSGHRRGIWGLAVVVLGLLCNNKCCVSQSSEKD